MKRVYIARRYNVIDEYGAKQFYEESAFMSYDDAYHFIQSMYDDDDDDDCMSEIVSYLIGSHTPWEDDQLWTFDTSGTLLGEYKRKQDSLPSLFVSPETYHEIFHVGEIVLIKANPLSTLAKESLGVVAWKPIRYEHWIAQGYAKDEWEGYYTVDFITTSGYLDHIHVQEDALKSYTQALPDELSFLAILSDHYAGKRALPAETLEVLYTEDIFVKKLRIFCEETYSITMM